MYDPLNSISETSFASALERIAEIKNLYSQIENKSTLDIKGSFSNVFNETLKNQNKTRFDSMINNVSKEHNIDPKLVKAVIEQESGFNPNAISRAGAIGLMQLMPETARDMGVKNPLNPYENITGGIKYLSSLLNRYQGDVTLALSAYNAGPTNVDKYKGDVPFKETKNYVQRIINKINL